MAFLRNTDSERTARKRTPTAFNSLKVALEGIELRMPVLWRTNWFVWDGSAPGWDHESRETRQDAYALVSELGYWADLSTWFLVALGCFSTTCLRLVPKTRSRPTLLFDSRMLSS